MKCWTISFVVIRKTKNFVLSDGIYFEAFFVDINRNELYRIEMEYESKKKMVNKDDNVYEIILYLILINIKNQILKKVAVHLQMTMYFGF